MSEPSSSDWHLADQRRRQQQQQQEHRPGVDIPFSSSSINLATQQPVPPTTTTPTPSSQRTTSHMPGVTLQPTSLAPPFFERPRVSGGFNLPTFPVQTLAPLATGVLQHASHQPHFVQNAPIAASRATAPAPAARTTRKSKAHVASACINCKRAHLSCDDQRPCARCVASGKQDTCYDVQHKKRGRPRLRDDSEPKTIRAESEPGRPTLAVSTTGEQYAARPIASARPRRTDSMRSIQSLQSRQSDMSMGFNSGQTYPYSIPTSASRSSFESYHQPSYRPPSRLAAPDPEIPTAYTDLNLVILRANRSFWHIMLGGHELVGRNMGDIATPADGESLLTIRNRLRRERDARDPASASPSTASHGPNPASHLDEANAEQYTRSFDDRTYTWTHAQMGPAGQTFPARVRLARAESYFVAITLPSFRLSEPRTPTYHSAVPSRTYAQVVAQPHAPYYASATHSPAMHITTPVPPQPTYHPARPPPSLSAGLLASSFPPATSSSFAEALSSSARPYVPPLSVPPPTEAGSFRHIYRPHTPLLPEPTSAADSASLESRRSSLAGLSSSIRLPPILASPMQDQQHGGSEQRLRALNRRSFDAAGGPFHQATTPSSSTAAPMQSSSMMEADHGKRERENEDDRSDSDSSRKRPRRMGIDDVLQ